MKLHHTKNFTTFAFHPNDNIIATGDVSGRICVWRGFGIRTFFKGNDQANANLMKIEDERAGVRGDNDVEACSTWHWHSSEVKFLAFSTDGANLYSGTSQFDWIVYTHFLIICLIFCYWFKVVQTKLTWKS